jgi:5-methylcytosine-specific restriction endonuclease McrA
VIVQVKGEQGTSWNAEVFQVYLLFVDLKSSHWKTHGQIRRFWRATGIPVDSNVTYKIETDDLKRIASLPLSRPARNPNKDTIRTEGRRQLPDLLAKGGGLCHWCHKPLVHLASLKPASIVSQTNTKVRWLDPDGKKQLSLIATADHLVAVADGGRNYKNLVPACKPCNQGRKSEVQKKLDAENAIAKEQERMMIRWLSKVKAKVEFGKPHRITVHHSVEGPEPRVVASGEHVDFVQAFNLAKHAYGVWHTSVYGYAGRGPGKHEVELEGNEKKEDARA